MNRLRLSSLVMFAALAAPSARAQDALATIKAAEYALGMIRGPQRIDAINTMEVWATGTRAAGGPPVAINYHASYSYRTPAMRIDVSPTGGTRQIEVINGDFSWNESVPGGGFIPGSTATPLPATLAERSLQMWTTPHGVLKAAERAAVANKGDAKVSKEGGMTVVSFPLTAPLTGISVKMTLNAKSEVEKVEATGTNAALGNVNMETTYAGYKDLGEIATDVMFPARIVQKRGGATVLTLNVSKVDANNPYVVFPVPDVVEKAPKAAR